MDCFGTMFGLEQEDGHMSLERLLWLVSQEIFILGVKLNIRLEWYSDPYTRFRNFFATVNLAARTHSEETVAMPPA
jgi:hypothetical protein